MHPLDVLKSRLDNLHGLKEKQNDLGKAQLQAGIAVARAFQRDEGKRDRSAPARRPPALRYVAFIAQLARGTAGKKVAARYGLHVADAIEPDAVASPAFRARELPALAQLMSRARQVELRLLP